jgi:adenine-specific DNA-methyltransferase
VLTLITSNKYVRASYGQKLRKLLADTTTIQQIIDFGDAPVFTAISHTSIIVAQKGGDHRSAVGSQRLANRDEHALLALSWNPTARLADFPQIIAEARRTVDERVPGAPLILQRSLGADGWRLEGAATQRLLDKLRRAGQPLGEYVHGRFYPGVLTGLNDAFVVDRATRDALVAGHTSSTDLLKPFLRGRDVKRWLVQFAEQYLIKIESSENKQHPWSGKDPIEAERIFEQTYPAIYQWFEPMRNDLIRRADQGQYYWEIRSYAYWQEFEQPKIILSKFMNQATFAFDRAKYFHNDALYMIAGTSEYTVAVLNSNVAWWFLAQLCTDLQNGYLQAFRKDLFRIPIPAPTSITIIEHTVAQIIAAKATDPAANVRAWEQEINERVYSLYGLRPDEIQMIEESVRTAA